MNNNTPSNESRVRSWLNLLMLLGEGAVNIRSTGNPFEWIVYIPDSTRHSQNLPATLLVRIRPHQQPP